MSNPLQAQVIAERGTIRIDAATLNYVVEGQGIPCLVIGSSVYYPRTFSAALRKHLKLYFVDMRWFTPDTTSLERSGYPLEKILSEIESVRKALKLDRCMILGHSIHGDLVLEYARRYPDHLTHVIAIGNPAVWGNESASNASTAYWEASEQARKNKLNINWETRKDSIAKLSGGEKFKATYITNGPRYWYDYTFDCAPLWKDVYVNTKLMGLLFKNFENYDVGDSREIINKPVLVVLGQYDFVVPYALWKKEYPNMPRLTLKILEKSGHTPQLEEAELFNTLLLDWINSQK